MPPVKNTDHRWQWFTDRVLPQLFVALVLAVSGGMWFTYQNVNTMISRMDGQQKEIDVLKADVSHIKANLVTKTELLETMKRVEQQLEIMMLRSKLNPVKVTE